MPNDFLSTREAAERLGINEKQVYALAKAGRIPATKVTGKWLFPRRLLDEWIEESARHGLADARRRASKISGTLLAAGSNDPLLDTLFSAFHRSHPDWYLFSASVGSTRGLHALGLGYTDIAWSHLWDASSDDWTVPYVKANFPDLPLAVVTLWHRQIGFVVAKGNPLGIQGFDDLGRKGLRIVNRQEGSGTRVLLDHHRERIGITPDAMEGYRREVDTHHEVALAVLSGDADAGIATGAVTSMVGLDFVPLAQERFDMVLKQSLFFDRAAQTILSILRSPGFRERSGWMRHYNFSESGTIVHAVA